MKLDWHSTDSAEPRDASNGPEASRHIFLGYLYHHWSHAEPGEKASAVELRRVNKRLKAAVGP